MGQQQTLFDDIEQWQLAAINAEAITLAGEAAALAALQNTDMDAYSELAASIEKISGSGMLEKKSQQLHALRKMIDQRAPVLYEKQCLALEKEKQYRKGLVVQGAQP